MKKLALFLLILISLSLIQTTFSQSLEPLELAKGIFKQDSKLDIQKYSYGEYEGEPSWKNLAPTTTLDFQLLEQTNDKAVVGMTITNREGQGFDSYLFFVKDNSIWKMSNFRALSQTGIIEQMVNSFSKLTESEIEKLIKKKDSVDPKAIFESREEFEFDVRNAKLTIALDKDIIAHFNQNKAQFETLKDSVLKKIGKPKDEIDEYLKTLRSDYRKLYISAISTNHIALENCLDFIIGGIGDNIVGYIYVADKKDLPKMDPSSIIVIKEIGNGWYLYKTT